MRCIHQAPSLCLECSKCEGWWCPSPGLAGAGCLVICSISWKWLGEAGTPSPSAPPTLLISGYSQDVKPSFYSQDVKPSFSLWGCLAAGSAHWDESSWDGSSHFISSVSDQFWHVYETIGQVFITNENRIFIAKIFCKCHMYFRTQSWAELYKQNSLVVWQTSWVRIGSCFLCEIKLTAFTAVIFFYSAREEIQAFKVTFKYENLIVISGNKNTAANNTQKIKILQWYSTGDWNPVSEENLQVRAASSFI